MDHERVGNHIKKHRKNLGLTQAQLAELVGVARVSIIAVENSRFLPTIETALRISKALNMPIESIFWLKENRQ
ncbi:MAG: helix-turn-helix transcriptional regulator [Chloroflexota bacterium]